MAPVSQVQATKAKVVNLRELIRTACKSLKQHYRLGLFSRFARGTLLSCTTL